MSSNPRPYPEDQLRTDQLARLDRLRGMGYRVEVSMGSVAVGVRDVGGPLPVPPGPFCTLHIDENRSVGGFGETVPEAFDDLLQRATREHGLKVSE